MTAINNHTPFEVRCKNVHSHIVVSEQYILDMISTFDANKAVGPDIITNKMLIAVNVQISKPLCICLIDLSIKIFSQPIGN
jgi:hypothetical protein